jgi:Fe2+ or Zn2+ uptake regulation protein
MESMSEISQVQQKVLALLQSKKHGEYSSEEILMNLKQKGDPQKQYHIADIRRVLTYLEDEGTVKFTRSGKFKAR